MLVAQHEDRRISSIVDTGTQSQSTRPPGSSDRAPAQPDSSSAHRPGESDHPGTSLTEEASEATSHTSDHTRRRRRTDDLSVLFLFLNISLTQGCNFALSSVSLGGPVLAQGGHTTWKYAGGGLRRTIYRHPEYGERWGIREQILSASLPGRRGVSVELGANPCFHKGSTAITIHERYGLYCADLIRPETRTIASAYTITGGDGGTSR